MNTQTSRLQPTISFKKVLLAAILSLFMVYFSANAAYAFADDACDPDYYESLEARAWLEAQREITQNQNLIFKPDSVLEYTCFDRYLDALAAAAPQMLSQTNRWGEPAGDMEQALSSLVGSSASGYINANFDHSFLGGRISQNYPLPAEVSAGAYSCEVMNTVWRAAKCMDFIQNAENDGFFTFEDYASGSDKRFLPTACSGGADYQGNINTAMVNTSTPWEEDDLITYYDLIYPQNGNCNPTVNGGVAKIKTGLTVLRQSGGIPEYEEHICVVPGCVFTPTSQTDGTCTRDGNAGSSGSSSTGIGSFFPLP